MPLSWGDVLTLGRSPKSISKWRNRFSNFSKNWSQRQRFSGDASRNSASELSRNWGYDDTDCCVCRRISKDMMMTIKRSRIEGGVRRFSRFQDALNFCWQNEIVCWKSKDLGSDRVVFYNCLISRKLAFFQIGLYMVKRRGIKRIG
jgi:hypothetical protein